jgi:two-component system phosphate regulon response regulator PhoB
LFVTAKVEPEDIVRGLEAGADDYLTKPFDNSVLLARVRAQLRRRSWENGGLDPDVIAVPGLTIFPKKFEVHQDGHPLDLTKSEFILLQSLLNNVGRVLTRKQLAEMIVGDSVNVVGRAVDTHIFTLRKKLGPQSELIETVRGVGYRVRVEDRA